MEELLACRVCLSTDIKLHDMYKFNLIEAYENLIGSQMTYTEGMPQHMCSYCTALLLKSVSFKEKCQMTQQLLACTVIKEEYITPEYINNLVKTHQLAIPYSIRTDIDEKVIKQENITNNKIDTNYIDNTIKLENSIENILQLSELNDGNDEISDEEPLSKKVKKKKLKYNVDVIFDNDHYDDGEENEVPEVSDSFDLNIDVVTLSKEEQIAEVQARKNTLNYINSYYKCDKCFKGFVTDSTYKNHMLRHDPLSGDHVCEICLTRWPDVRSLRAHLSTTHEKNYICKLCNQVSKSGQRAKEHSKWHKGYKYVCNICGASFSKSTSHLTHIRLQHPSSKHTCDVCGESFIGEYGLKMHKKRAHTLRQNTLKKEDHKCLLCGVNFTNVEALKRHTSELQNDVCNMRSCVKCGDSFETEELFVEHTKTHKKEEVRCDECNRTFAHERSFAVHYQRVHLGVKMKHEKPCKSGANSVVCEICGKTCFSKATLVYHQRTHTGEKPYQCVHCPKSFTIFQRLKIHLRTHTGERPFKCQHCTKAFKHKAALNRHDRVHTGAKPYTCGHCGKSFSQSNSMKTHVRTVHLKMAAPYRSRRNNKTVNE